MGNFVLHFLLKMCTIKEEIQTERNRRDDMVVHEFSDCEALRIAAEIERKGERFYRMAMGVTRGGKAHALMEMLRAQEEAHAARFEQMLSEVEDEGEEESYDAEANAFLSAVAAEVVFPGGVLASLMNRRLETVRDVLLYAIGSEKDSLLFYMEMLLKTRNEGYKRTLEGIIEEEKKHLSDLQQLLEATA